jgi:hypothetical protein
MSAEIQMLGAAPDVGAIDEDSVRRIVREEIARAFAKDPAKKRAAIIASKGTLDWAYPPLILANAAAATGMETAVFFTFYGLNIIHRDFEKRIKSATRRCRCRSRCRNS